MIYNYPKQRVSTKEKQNIEWYKPCYDFLIAKAISMNNKDLTRQCLQAANGIVDEDTYDYVLKPLTGDGDTLRNLPGTIRNVDFLTPIREKNMGEYMELPYKTIVTVVSPDISIKKNHALGVEIEKLMQQAFINLVNQTMETGVESKEVPDMKAFADDFNKKYIDDRVIQGQKRLNLLNSLTDFDTMRLQDYSYWWSCEEFYTYRWIENGEIRKESIHPLEAYPIDNGEQFVEDYDGFVRIQALSLSQFIDSYRDKIDDEDWAIINTIVDKGNTFQGADIPIPIQIFQKQYANTSLADFYNQFNATDSFSFIDSNRVIKVYTITWKTEKKIKILTYLDSNGEECEVEVTEDYKLDKSKGDIKIEIDWINTVMTGTRIGDERIGIYIKPEEELIQRRDPNNSSKVKLPYGGKKGVLTGIDINPIPKRILPYLALYRIYTLEQERCIAKYQPSIMLVPKSMLAEDSTGTTKDKYFYMKADNTLIYDDTEVDFNTVAQGFRIVGNPGLENYIRSLNELRKSTIEEAFMASHMNDERFGNINPNATATGSMENIKRAKLGTYMSVFMFNKALEKDHIADLEYSKVAWIDDKVGTYLDKDTQQLVEVTVEGIDHLETEYGIFVVNANEEMAKLKGFKDLAFSMGQNGDFEMSAVAINSDNSVEIQRKISEFSDKKREFETQNQNASLEQAKQIHQEQMDNEEKNRQNYLAGIELQNKGKYEVEMIKSDTASLGTDVNENNIFDNFDINKMHELRMKTTTEANKLGIENRKLDIKEKEIKSKEKIATVNRNRFSK